MKLMLVFFRQYVGELCERNSKTDTVDPFLDIGYCLVQD